MKSKKSTIKYNLKDTTLKLIILNLLKDRQKISFSNSILKDAVKIYKEGIKNKETSAIIKNADIAMVAGGVLCAALKKHKKILFGREVAFPLGLDDYEIGRICGFLCYKLNIEVSLPELAALHNLLKRLEERHVLSDETWAYSEALFREAYKKGVKSTDWVDVAAAIICIAALKNKDGVSPKDIADAAEISRVTLLARLKELNEKLNLKEDFSN